MLERRIDSIKVRNYRSLADVEVQLEDLTVLVGENGSGKSNLVDVLRFVRDALTKGLDAAMLENRRGRIKNLLYADNDSNEIEIEINLIIDRETASYHIILEMVERNEYQIQLEQLKFGRYWYTVQPVKGEKVVSSTWEFHPNLELLKRNLLLPLISSSEVKPVYDILTNTGFYNIIPARFQYIQPVLTGSYPMSEDGSDILNTLQSILEKHPRNAQVIANFLSRIVPSIVEENPLKIDLLGENYLVGEIQHKNGLFDLSQESDGTLRALGILTALFQLPYLPLISIEEPEIMIHPQAMGLLCDALKAASARSQIIITTHSPDLISRFEPESLRVVEIVDGETKIDKLKEANLEAINKKLFSGGDLLRIGALGRA